jgi:hypothetical protein
VVEPGPGLDEWRRAAGDAVDVPGAGLFHPDVRILGAQLQAAGAIANRSGAVVGVSNVFARDGVTPATWADITSAIGTVFPGLAIVGYEQGDPLEAALQDGFDDIGPLRIWLAR